MYRLMAESDYPSGFHDEQGETGGNWGCTELGHSGELTPSHLPFYDHLQPLGSSGEGEDAVSQTAPFKNFLLFSLLGSS